MLPSKKIEAKYYLDESGGSPFAKWFDALDEMAAAKVTVFLARMEAGNLSNIKSVGEGVFERRIDFGPGYRVYFGREGDKFVILLGGGSKKRQQRDIAEAKKRWKDYKRRKTGSEGKWY
jgi:putative addiction module killer protein